ncbi:hypothetical protein [Arthrobacter sp. NEB 688]|uniref:hypothetical protein n=1 Tax=Arthrobacter sp. NEB 688 TaxID=904039 RepID=UPI0015660F54|nr:hypothetical protein [Arthrobacter sp. NEB 688]QKE84670.1 hypothetical protein HL663_12470 [Arthrobacter sp. NEB 688]
MQLNVRAIHTFPERGGAAVEHDAVAVAADGLEGDRRKRAAVSIVGHDSPHTRANLVLSAPTADVEGLAGAVVRIGDTLLAVEGTGNACAGLYAAVGRVGTVRVGDVVELVEHDA